MRDRKIRWKKGDRISLGIAISKFNKKINELRQQDESLNLPEELNYKNVSNKIYTRTALNTHLNIINSFLNADVTSFKKNKSDLVTPWEQERNSILLKNARRYINKELGQMESGFGMGNMQYNQLNSTLQSLDNIYTSTQSNYKNKISLLEEYGFGQKNIQKANTFQENFIEIYSKSNFKNKRKLIEFAKSFENSQDFWDYMKDSNLVDLKQEYDIQRGLISFGDDEDNFNYELKQLQII